MKSYFAKYSSWRQALVAFLIATMIFPSLLPSTEVTASSSAEQEILAAFETLQKSIGGASFGAKERTSLAGKVAEARGYFSKGEICAAAKSFESFFDEAQGLRQGRLASTAEDLHNRAWSLRQDVLSILQKGKACDASVRANQPPVVEIAESDNRHIRGTVRFGEPKMSSIVAEGELYTEVELPGLQAGVGEPGTPGVPVLHKLVAIPQGAKPEIKVRANYNTARTFKLNLYPIQPEPMDAVSQKVGEKPPADRFPEAPFTKNKDIYATDRAFPAETGKVTHLGKSRDLQMAQLSIAAGHYNPGDHTLVLFESVEFEIIFNGGKGAFLTSAAFNPFDNSIGTIGQAVVNRDLIGKYVIADPRILKFFGEEFLILTHPDFREAADALAKWKNEKGILTNVFNVNDGAGSGPDTKEEIDEFIENRYRRGFVRPSYVLLLGDAEFIPPFYVNTSGSATTGSDYPYALLSSDDDLLPDFALGRIPVDTLDQADTVVNKVIKYEKNPPFATSFYNNVGIASQFQCCRSGNPQGRDQRSFIETSELVRNELLNRGYGVDRIYTATFDGNGGNTPRRFYNGTVLPADLAAGSGFAWDGDTDDIVDAWNAGRFLFLHRDHGWEDGWADPSFTSTNVDNDLTNGARLPVVFSVNCASGLFDNETANGDYGTDVDGVYFSERLLRKSDGGAVGVLGDTRNSPTWANSALTRGFFDAVWPNTVADFGDNTSHRRLGDILNHGKLYLATQIGVAGTTEAPSQGNFESEVYMWHVLGDPTLEMWTAVPLKILKPWYTAKLELNLMRIEYQINNAIITAYQETRAGLAPIGRAQVRNGQAEIVFVQKPQPGAEIHLAASFKNAVSVKLAR